MIVLKSSESADWPWTNAGDNAAESVFRRTYPSLHAWLAGFQHQLRKRQDQGTFWWELRSCDYYSAFECPKIAYQVIAFHSRFALDRLEHFSNDKTFFLPSNNEYLLAVLNSSLMWWLMYRDLPHMKDEALAMQGYKVEQLPIPEARKSERAPVQRHSAELVELTRVAQQQHREYQDDLERALGAFKLSDKLETFWRLTSRAAETELRRCAETKPTAARLAGAIALHDKHATAIGPVLRKIAQQEMQLQELVFRLYGLDAAEVQLLRSTAPPRDPLTLAEQQLARLGSAESGAREAG